MTEDVIYVIGHRHPDTDSILSAIAYAHLKNVLGFASVRPARAGEINSETRYVLERFSLHEPELLTDAAGRHVILVDHNEIAQALPGIQNATIEEVWEHHRIGDLDIPRPIMFHCEPVGAAATLIAEQYFFHQIVPSPAIAAGLLAAVLSDTLIFSSPTCSEKDRQIAQQLAKIAKLDATALGQDLIAARGDVAGRQGIPQAASKRGLVVFPKLSTGAVECAASSIGLSFGCGLYDRARLDERLRPCTCLPMSPLI